MKRIVQYLVHTFYRAANVAHVVLGSRYTVCQIWYTNEVMGDHSNTLILNYILITVLCSWQIN